MPHFATMHARASWTRCFLRGSRWTQSQRCCSSWAASWARVPGSRRSRCGSKGGLMGGLVGSRARLKEKQVWK
eukprot:352100-Chlamydomonas_euryale.AAC.3